MSASKVRAGLAAIGLAFVVALGACGDDGGAGSTTAATAATTTTAAAPTSTTAAATTTTTTVPADLHPAWPVSWASLWPSDGSVAAYLAADEEGASLETSVGIEYGVYWEGDAWDRIYFGSPEPGSLGVSFYFQRPEPWVIRVGGVVTYGPTGFVMTERFEPVVTLDLLRLPEEEILEEATLVISNAEGLIQQVPYYFGVSFVGFETVEVAAGRFEESAHVRLIAGESLGAYQAENDLWIADGQLLVRLAPAHIFDSLELAQPWGE